MSNNRQLYEQYLSKQVRDYIENTFYARITEQSKLDNLVHDKSFMEDMSSHIGLFSDHGIVHVRDVARLILETIEVSHGVHIAPRSEYRLNFMRGYGVIVAYLHDIGMIHFSKIGRATHSQFAAQEVYSGSFDHYFDIIWEENCGNVPWRILALHEEGLITADPKNVLREMLALVPAHSKSQCDIKVLNNSAKLRQNILDIIEYDLEYIYYLKQIETSEEIFSGKQFESTKYSKKTQTNRKKLYTNFRQEAYTWLLSDEPEILDFIDDIKDTLRLLRCADSFRQRGTSYKTSGGYQMFTDLYSGNAICCFSNEKNQLFLFEDSSPHAIGEANIASTKYTAEGDLAISFYTGLFKSNEAREHVAKSVAFVIYDIVLDVIDSLILPDDYRDKGKISKTTPIKILLEDAPDGWDFTRLIGTELTKLAPSLKDRIVYTIQLNAIPNNEKNRYLNGKEFNGSLEDKKNIIKMVAVHGHKIDGINVEEAFEDTKLISINPGEYLIKAGDPAGFIYLSFNEGLLGLPLGGYETFKIAPYALIGNSSAISGTERNANIIADAEVELLMIPQEVYLKHWHHTFNEKEFRLWLEEIYQLK